MKKHKNKILAILIISAIVVCLIVPLAYSRYSQLYSKDITLNIRKPGYTIIFNSNRNDGQADNTSTQDFVYGTSQKLAKNTFSNGTLFFQEWNTERDGSGTSYNDEQQLTTLSSTDGDEITLYAIWTAKVARIGDKLYDSLVEAIGKVNKNGTLETVELLTNTAENVVIAKTQNIILELNGHTLTDPGTGCTLTNNGTLVVRNGEISSYSTTDGTINNNSTGNIILDGVRALKLKSNAKQAFYNDKGIAEIKGNSYISTISTIRAAAQNVAGGTLTITSGTIVQAGTDTQPALQNAGTLIIGTEDGVVNRDNPVFIGNNYGINSTVNYSFFDGIAKGKAGGVNDRNKVTGFEQDYSVTSGEEMIDGVRYATSYMAISHAVTFDPTGGTLTETIRNIEHGNKIGLLPTPNKHGQAFEGWYTLAEGGDEISEDQIINQDETYYAHWTDITVARIGNDDYSSLQDAVDSVEKNNVQVEIIILRDTNENINVKSGQNILLNIGAYTMHNSGDDAVITNNGTLTIYNGTISSTADTGTINNKANAVLNVTGGNILAANRPAIYNEEYATTNISGGYMESSTSGKRNNGILNRATVHNLENGTVNITGGVIVGKVQQAVSNEGKMNIGVKDGSIDTTSPRIIGNTYGLASVGTLKFYDGIVLGITDAISGDINEIEDYAQMAEEEEIVDNTTYIAHYLESTE